METTTVEIKKFDYFGLEKKLMKELTPNEERVYRCLLSHKNKDQEYSFPSQELIAEETNVSISTVKRAIKALAKKGFIIIEKMKRIIGHYNRYKLLYVACMSVVRAKKEAKKQSNQNINEVVVEEVETQENKESNVNKILNFTKIKKISDKQRESLKEFDIITINQTIARIKARKTKKPRTATGLIMKLCDTAIGLGKFKEWQYKKYGQLRPTNHTEEIEAEESIIKDEYEDLLGWDF